MILTLKIFSKNLKLHVWYCFGTLFNILRGKKSKMVRITARSIWAGISHIFHNINVKDFPEANFQNINAAASSILKASRILKKNRKSFEA